MPPQALVLFSGGQDSTTCLAQALADYPGQVEAVGFNYGQLHHIELDQAAFLAQKAGVPFHVVDLRFLSAITSNALMDASIKIESLPGQLPSTFVEGRNVFFLSTAAVIAKQKGIRFLYTGVCETDYSGYPDCRENFIRSIEHTLSLAMDYPFTVVTPLMRLTKAETVVFMQKLGKLDWYAHTHTCYKGMRPACGQCPACVLRLKGFREAGIADPLAYMG